MNRIRPTSSRSPRPLIISLCAGGGGVGRSTLAAELARSFVRKGLRVLLVDADLHHPTQHQRFDATERWAAQPWSPSLNCAHLAPPNDPSASGSTDPRVPELLILGQDHVGRPRAHAPDVRALHQSLRDADFDVIFLDQSSGLDEWTVSMSVLADVPAMVVATEPVSLDAGTRYMRRAIFSAMRLLDEAEGIEQVIDETSAQLPANWALGDLREAAERTGAADLLNEAMNRLEPYIILSQTREAAEREIGPVLGLAWWYLTGVRPRYAGAIDHDGRRWFHLRQGNLLPPLNSEFGAGFQLEELSKKLIDPARLDAEQPRQRAKDVPAALYLLGLSADTPAPEVRMCYRKLWEGVRRDHVGTQQLLNGPLRDKLIQDLESANRDLQTWLSERSTNTTTTEAQPARPRGPGARIRDRRRSMNLTEREVSLRTKIGLKVLKAIEEFDTPALPRATYLRQYLREIALVLNLDADSLMDEYLTAFAEAQRARILTRGQDNR